MTDVENIDDNAKNNLSSQQKPQHKPQNKPQHTPQHNPHHKPKTRAFLGLCVGIIILCASLAIVSYWIKNKSTRPIRPSVVELPYVETMPVALSSNLVKISAGGFVSAKTSAHLTPQVNGKIISISPQLHIGELVKKGETLIQLDKTNYQTARENARTAVVTATSAYEQEKGRARQAARDVKRLGIKATELSLRKPQLAAARAAVKNAQAQLTLAQSNVNRTTITAPFDGIVESTDAAIAEIATSGRVLVTLAATDTYSVKLTLSSQHMKLVHKGDIVTIVDSTYGNTYQTIISRIAPGIDSKNRTIAVYADINNPLGQENPLLLSSYVTATITGARIPHSAHIPNSSIINNAFVWHMKADNSIAQLPVTIINRTADTSLVRFQTPIDNLIIRPKDSFIAGQQVTTNNTITTPSLRKGKPKAQSSVNNGNNGNKTASRQQADKKPADKKPVTESQ